jgi:hypothetical protein
MALCIRRALGGEVVAEGESLADLARTEPGVGLELVDMETDAVLATSTEPNAVDGRGGWSLTAAGLTYAEKKPKPEGDL